MSRKDLLERLDQLLDGDPVTEEWDEAALLAEVIRPASPRERTGEERVVQFSKPRERFGVIERALRRATGRRPAILLLDDTHWGLDALAFVQFLLTSQVQHPSPILVLMTVQTEALVHRPMVQGFLQNLGEVPNVFSMHLPPLTESEIRTLVGSILLLDKGLSEQVVHRSGGNPMFAVELVRDWAHRDVLVSTPTGFKARAGEHFKLPEDLDAISADRIHALTQQLAPEEVSALYLAAGLGLQVLESEWMAVCERAQISTPLTLIDQLVVGGLAQPLEQGEGFAFAHSMFRESLLSRMSDAGRSQWCHRHCAESLDPDEPHNAARLARHWVAAGELPQALPLYQRGTRTLRLSGLSQSALLLHDEWRMALQAGSVPASDGRWGPFWDTDIEMCAYDTARDADTGLETLRHGVTELDWTDMAPKLHIHKARRAAATGEIDTAIALSRKAVQAETMLERPTSYVHKFLALYLMRHGNLEEALSVGQRALELARQEDDTHAIATVTWSLATTCLAAGQISEATTHLAAAAQMAERHGHRNLAAGCANLLGEICRKQGDLDAAEEHYQRTAVIWESTAHQHQAIPRINLALVRLEKGDHQAAQTALRGCLARVQQEVLLSTVHLGLAVTAAHARDWQGFDQHLPVATRIIERIQLIDPDNGHLARLAGEAAHGASEMERARAAFRLARTHAERLGNTEEASRLSSLMADLV